MSNIELMLGQIKGTLEEANKNNEKDHKAIIKYLDEVTTKYQKMDVRVVSLETDRKIVSKIAGFVSAVVSMILIALSRMIDFKGN